MRRREFISLLGGAAAAWPLAARAQQGERVRRIGVLMNTRESDPFYRSYAAAFAQTLQRVGWREGENLQLDLRWTAANAERIAAEDAHHTNHLRAGVRSSYSGFRSQLGTSRRQHHRVYLVRAIHRRQMAGFSQTGGAWPRARCRHLQS